MNNLDDTLQVIILRTAELFIQPQINYLEIRQIVLI